MAASAFWKPEGGREDLHFARVERDDFDRDLDGIEDRLFAFHEGEVEPQRFDGDLFARTVGDEGVRGGIEQLEQGRSAGRARRGVFREAGGDHPFPRGRDFRTAGDAELGAAVIAGWRAAPAGLGR